MSYVNQLHTITNLIPPNRTRTRVHCPFCGGRNTLSISRVNGTLLWNCHRASCDASGGEQGQRTFDDIRARLSPSTKPKDLTFDVPTHFTNVLSEERAVAYLRRNNCMLAYSKRLADIRYDPKQDRVVFMCKDKGRIIGATGRALVKGTQPKWYRYDSNQTMFAAGNSDIGVLVEDAASACAVSPIATGIALMGTNLSQSNVGMLLNYREIIVALDPDAQRKGIELSRLIGYYTKVRTALIENDLKYFTIDTIADMLRLK